MILKYGPYSPSRLETATCPYSFYRQYIDIERRVSRREEVPQARGSAVHEVFEHLTHLMRSNINGRITIAHEELQKLITEAVIRHPAAYPEVKEIMHMADKYLEHPPKILTEDAEIELKVAVKWEDDSFKECSYDDPEAFVRGRADIMVMSDNVDKVYLYDHKTQPNIEAADTFQLGLYAWVISKAHPYLNEIHTILHFARYGSYSADCIWVKNEEIRQRLLATTDIDPKYVLCLTDIEQEILARIQIIEGTRSWDVAIPHKNCQYCPVMAECPVIKDILQFDAEGIPHIKAFHITRDTERAVKVAGYLNLFEEIVKDLKGDLKEHVSFSGSPISIPGKTYCFSASESVDWDTVNKKLKNKAYAIFEEYGIDPKQFMSFNQTASKSVWQLGNEDLVKKLAEIFPRKVSTEFRGVRT